MLLCPVHDVAAALREASVLGLLRHPHIVPYKVNLRNLCNLLHCKVCCWVMAVDQVLPVLDELSALPMQEFFNHEGDLCLVMAYCDGGDLFNYIKNLK